MERSSNFYENRNTQIGLALTFLPTHNISLNPLAHIFLRMLDVESGSVENRT